MKSMSTLRSGFTLVELLIVIVVIAILAAITIVAYNGIQERANNTTTVQGTEAYVKALNFYALDHDGDYPATTGCLGTDYPGGKCLSQNSTAACWGMGSASSTTLNTALLPYMNNTIPTISMQKVSCGGTEYIGAYANYNSTTGSMGIYMVLSGSQNCPPMSPNVTSSATTVLGGGTRCYYNVAPPS